ncbi:unnamed protein product [Withania somnifera]
MVKSKDPTKFIKDGLSKTFVFYYPLADRLIEGPNKKLMVNCNGEGILFVEADANVELEELDDSIKPPCPYLLNHAMMDVYGLNMFLNALSEFIQGASTSFILPVWQRHLLSARSLPNITCTHHEFDEQLESKTAWESMENKLVQQSFLFGNKKMEDIKNQFSPNSECFELLVAFLWKCRTIALDLDPEGIVPLTFVINICEKSLKFELPPKYYGNAFITPAAMPKEGVMCSNPLTYVVELVKKLKDHMNEEYVRLEIDLIVIKGKPRITKPWNFLISG